MQEHVQIIVLADHIDTAVYAHPLHKRNGVKWFIFHWLSNARPVSSQQGQDILITYHTRSDRPAG